MQNKDLRSMQGEQGLNTSALKEKLHSSSENVKFEQVTKVNLG